MALRLGEYFGAIRYGYQPDIITCAKGITSGYVPLGAMIASGRLAEPFLDDKAWFAHGITFGGHPVATAVALTNLDIFELVKDKATKQSFTNEESERLLRGFLSKALFTAGLHCRADDRGDPVIQLAPPLICDETHFAEIEHILRAVLTEASQHI